MSKGSNRERELSEEELQGQLDAVSEFSASCPRRSGCEDLEDNGLESCAECMEDPEICPVTRDPHRFSGLRCADCGKKRTRVLFSSSELENVPHEEFPTRW
jgi:hypothetical protein